MRKAIKAELADHPRAAATITVTVRVVAADGSVSTLSKTIKVRR